MYKKGEPMVLVNFRLPQDALEDAVGYARERGISLSEWLREAVDMALQATAYNTVPAAGFCAALNLRGVGEDSK